MIALDGDPINPTVVKIRQFYLELKSIHDKMSVHKTAPLQNSTFILAIVLVWSLENHSTSGRFPAFRVSISDRLCLGIRWID